MTGMVAALCVMGLLAGPSLAQDGKQQKQKQKQQQQQQQMTKPEMQEKAMQQDPLPGAELETAVVEELFEDQITSGYAIEVDAREGIITLTGTTNNIMAKRRAEKLAQAIRGVRSVINRIEVDPLLRSDDEIQEDVLAALTYDRATESFQIDVSVEEQVVTLGGSVDSWQEKQLAAKVAGSVRGVKEVDNKIRVYYETDRPDHEIAEEVRQALNWNALVDDALIDVSVDEGTVMLSGVVGSAAEKREARYEAWVSGVDDVETDQLEVARWARDKDLRMGGFAAKSDEKVAQAIEDAMKYDPRVSPFEIEASVDDGVVTLTGEVNTVRAKRAAARNARNTMGVWRVKNRIRVSASTPTDAQIEQNIENALLRNPTVDRYEIYVSVIDGEAILTGTVDTFYEKAEAEDIASVTYGVTEVNNNLTVEDAYDPLTYDPYVEEYYPYEYDWYNVPDEPTTKSDWEITEDINDELQWSPYVEADEVLVSVNNGVATLTGEVDTWNERRAATENAYDGGATIVENNLSVEYGPDYYDPDVYGPEGPEEPGTGENPGQTGDAAGVGID
jgi:osmotically-inducible protein OsmY